MTVKPPGTASFVAVLPVLSQFWQVLAMIRLRLLIGNRRDLSGAATCTIGIRKAAHTQCVQESHDPVGRSMISGKVVGDLIFTE